MVYDFSCRNFKDFCSVNNLDKRTARRIIFDRIDSALVKIGRLENELKELKKKV